MEMIQRLWLFGLLAFLTFTTDLSAQDESSRQLTLQRLFESGEFGSEGAPGLRWSHLTPHYIRRQAGDGGTDFVKVSPESEEQELFIPAKALIPTGAERPIGVEDYELSADESKVLIFNNSRRVWRQNTRGDYWVLDRVSGQLRQLGGDAPESTLMFAKFSPDGASVAYVRENNLYVERLSDGQITRLTSDCFDWIVNGTSDWVNEEELDIRDAFRWSPDGRSIAYWQFDTSGVPRFQMIDNTSANGRGDCGSSS